MTDVAHMTRAQCREIIADASVNTAGQLMDSEEVLKAHAVVLSHTDNPKQAPTVCDIANAVSSICLVLAKAVRNGKF